MVYDTSGKYSQNYILFKVKDPTRKESQKNDRKKKQDWDI